MSQDNDNLMWIVVPTSWGYDDQHYHCSGFDLPTASFTQKEMAEEYAVQTSISDFKKIASEECLSGYLTPYLDVNLEELREAYPFINSDMCIPQRELNSLPDKTILKVMEDIGLEFYKVVGVKIYC